MVKMVDDVYVKAINRYGWSLTKKSVGIKRV